MENPTVIVTGAGGFVGGRLVSEMLTPSSPIKPERITTIDVNFNDSFDDDPRISQVRCTIENYKALEPHFQGCDIVFHMAAVVDWGTRSEEEVYRTNVEGTRNVVEACRKHGVKVLIFTSSLDAIFGGKPVCGADETIPYPDSYPNIYCKSKADAERIVMKANDSSLKTVCLRPADIFGEGDPFHIDALLSMAKKNMYIRIGDGTAKSQHVYVGNVARAHLLAASSVWEGNEKPCGKVYFITDGEPSNFFLFFDDILRRAGYRLKPENVWLPAWFMYLLGTLNEFIAFLVRPFFRYNPNVSRFAVTYTCSEFTFTSKKAKEDFGFTPFYSEEEALKNTAAYYRIVSAEEEMPSYNEG